MALQLWTGKGKFRHTNENRASRDLIQRLRDAFSLGDQLVIAIFNVDCGNELDLLILKRDGIAVVDFKECHCSFHASVSDKWLAADGHTIQSGQRYRNPFDQVATYRHEFIRLVEKERYLGKREPGYFRRAAAVVAVWPTLPSVLNDVDPGKNPWFWLVGVDQLPALVADLAQGIRLSDPDLSAFVRRDLGCVPLDKLHKVKVFLCYVNADKRFADAVLQGLGSWPAIEIFSPAPELANYVELARLIENSDHILCIISDNAWGDKYVSRVLGLASSLGDHRRAKSPSIFGVVTDDSCSVLEFPTEAWPGSPDRNSSIDFALCGRFPYDRSYEELANELKAKVTIYDGAESHSRLLARSFEVYEELFPNPGERSRSEDIEVWLAATHSPSGSVDPWVEIFAILHAAENVMGIANFSTHAEREWLYGSYFGVRHGWRRHNRAEAFLYELRAHLRTIAPGARGIVFEIEPVDFPLLTRAATRQRVGGFDDEDQIAASLRAARRLGFYQSYQCLTILGPSGEPPRYRHPALCEPLNEDNERGQLIMVHLFEFHEADFILRKKVPSEPVAQAVIDFIYELYADSYGEHTRTAIPGYDLYLANHRSTMFRTPAQWSLGNWRALSEYRTLLKTLTRRVSDEGWADKLEL